MKVFVYRNITKRCYSVMALEGENKGRVVAHVKMCTLTDVQFRVRPAGREKVRRTRQKNVHAGLVGQWSGEPDSGLPWDTDWPCKYNPYTQDYFEVAGRPIHKTRKAFCGLTGLFVALEGG